MKLTVKKRTGETKGQTKQMRRDGKVPAVFYAPGKENQSIEIDGAQFDAALRKIKTNHLSTTIFSLDMEGTEQKAIVKGIQYNRTSYDVIHLDFAGLEDATPVTIDVPILCLGVSECIGIKLGGALRQVLRNIKVSCLPKDIPTAFELDVRDLKMRQSKKVSDLKLPSGVKPISTSDEVLVIIAKR